MAPFFRWVNPLFLMAIFNSYVSHKQMVPVYHNIGVEMTISNNSLSRHRNCRWVTLCGTRTKRCKASSPKAGKYTTWQAEYCAPFLADPNGYGSIPINTIFRGMNIHKSQLFWCELQGYKVLTHCQIYSVFETALWKSGNGTGGRFDICIRTCHFCTPSFSIMEHSQVSSWWVPVYIYCSRIVFRRLELATVWTHRLSREWMNDIYIYM